MARSIAAPVLVLLLAARATLPAGEPAQAEPAPTAAEIAALTFDDVAEDFGWITPFAREREVTRDDPDFAAFLQRLDAWEPARQEDEVQRLRHLLAIAALLDLGQSGWEAEFPLVLLERLRQALPRERLVAALGTIVLRPQAGGLPTAAQLEALQLEALGEEAELRERIRLYAKKQLGRVVGRLPRD